VSALGAVFSRVLGAMGGPGTAAIMAGGIVVGALGGGLVAGGGSSQPASATGSLAVYPCPGTGAPLTMIQAGQKLLATGRTEDSTWLRIHFPEPGRTEAWVEAGPLQVQGSIAGLPVAECAPETAAATPSFGPAPTLTAVLDTPPTAAPTTEPTAAPTPTGTPDKAPSLTALTVSTNKLSYDTGNYCPGAVNKATFTVKATDDVGIAKVTLFWREPGAGSFAQTAMTRTAGNARNGTWSATLGTVTDGITAAGTLSFYAVGTDSSGATKRIPVKGSDSISVKVCVNTGPTISGAASSSGSSLYWDPLGVGSCQTATNITATIKDSDGIKSATLFFKRPGSSTWSSKAMDSNTVKGKWYANLDTLGDKIFIPNPPTGTLRWYIKAVDGAGLSSQMSSRTITVKRCDTEAQFDGVFPTSSGYPCTSTRITIGTYADDQDQPEYGLKVVFHWKLENRRTNPKPVSGTITARRVGNFNYYEGRTALFDGKTFYSGFLTVYAVTTDKYGGTTTSPVDTYNMSCG
jgi:hypothetical protein